MVNNIFFANLAVYVEKYGTAGQATHENMAHVPYTLNT
jgi:hypothetical protein